MWFSTADKVTYNEKSEKIKIFGANWKNFKKCTKIIQKYTFSEKLEKLAENRLHWRDCN